MSSVEVRREFAGIRTLTLFLEYWWSRDLCSSVDVVELNEAIESVVLYSVDNTGEDKLLLGAPPGACGVISMTGVDEQKKCSFSILGSRERDGSEASVPGSWRRSSTAALLYTRQSEISVCQRKRNSREANYDQKIWQPKRQSMSLHSFWNASMPIQLYLFIKHVNVNI